MTDFDVFQHKRLQPCLYEIFQKPQLIGRKRMSLNIWAEKLGYKSPRSVGMIFEGQRLPSVMMLDRLSTLLSLNYEQREYLFSLLSLEKLKQQTRNTEALEVTIEKMSPVFANEQRLDEFKFSYIAEWYHLVIKQMIKNDFTELDPVQMARDLKNKVQVEDIQTALKKLCALQIIEADSSGRAYRLKVSTLSTMDDIPSVAIRKHHAGMMERASEALLEEGVETREFSSATFSFDRQKIKEVKDLIRGFRNKLEKFYAHPESRDVYQLNIQFFSHTKGKSND